MIAAREIEVSQVKSLAVRVDGFAHDHGASQWETARRCRRFLNKAIDAETPSGREFGLQLALVEFRRLVRRMRRLDGTRKRKQS